MSYELSNENLKHLLCLPFLGAAQTKGVVRVIYLSIYLSEIFQSVRWLWGDASLSEGFAIPAPTARTSYTVLVKVS